MMDTFETFTGRGNLKTPYVQVVFNHPLRDSFTYRIPATWETIPCVGSRVLAPFSGKAKQLGFVVGYTGHLTIDPSRIKDLEAMIDEEELIPPLLYKLLEWLADYYFSSLGEALFAAFPFGTRNTVRQEQVVVPGPEWIQMIGDPKLSEKRRKVLSCFEPGKEPTPPVFTITGLAHQAQVTPAVIRGLIEKGALQLATRIHAPRLSEAESLYQTSRPVLTEDQQLTLELVGIALRQETNQQFLLHGVTGSGKTEVFLQGIEETLALGKTALVLVPEIALTPQTAARYRGRFPGMVEVLHSALSQPRRFEAWQRARKGESPIVVGTRSAIFVPLPRLGLIVVDEEHDASYKQTDPAPRYHARDVACYRAMLEKAVIVLGSATPSLESYENVLRKKSRLLYMPNRATAYPLPAVELVDMRHRQPSERILSMRAREVLEETHQMGLQSILFLNRRGHSTQLECRECSKALECPNCSVTLVWHSRDLSLRCHHCGYLQAEPENCPHCQSVWLRARGYGTEQVLEVVQACLPQARAERIDLDATQEIGSHDQILSRFRKGEIDILVGTQMVSKGIDMPRVRTVVVVQAETSLNVADFRSAERSFALLTQVAGRAGRGDHPGLVLVQSFAPGHYAIFSALRHDYLGFRRIETKIRRNLGLPPHTRLVNFRCESEETEKAEATIRQLAEILQQSIRVNGHFHSLCGERLSASPHPTQHRLIGPAPCPLEKLAARWRWQVLVAVRDGRERTQLLQNPQLYAFLVKPPYKVKITVDVDPMNVL
jgi:primosomal protein N' (replication factor Y)